MSGLKEQIEEDVKKAMKSRDQLKLDTLRMVVSTIKNKEIEKKGSLDDGTVSSIVSTLVKQRREAAELYRKGQRDDLAEKEEQEIVFLKEYLPEEMSEDELGKVIDVVIEEEKASSAAHMGQVMKMVMSRVAGRADGKVVSNLVRIKLTQ